MISFPRLECWNNTTKTATLVADVDKRRVLCKISLFTLREKFNSPEGELMLLVAKYRPVIHAAATNLIEQEIYEEDGSVLIKKQDL